MIPQRRHHARVAAQTPWGWIILDRLFDIDVDSSDIDIEVSTVDQTDY
jgi:hypothetical protein